MFSRKNKWKSSLYLIEHHSMKVYVEVEEQTHSFLTSALDKDEW